MTGGRLARVIAIVGSDGAGKSRLAADLVERLGRSRPATFLYLGQSSGNIVRAIRRLPVAGAAIGRLLKARSERTHATQADARPPDLLSASVIHALSRWRFHKFRRLLALERRGVTVVTDRFPQAERPSFHFDGPGLDPTTSRGAVRTIAKREARLYARMAAWTPALVIRLNVDAATAHARKPEDRLETLELKTRVIPTLGYGGAPLLDLDGRAPYHEVLAAAWGAVTAALGDPPRP